MHARAVALRPDFLFSTFAALRAMTLIAVSDRAAAAGLYQELLPLRDQLPGALSLSLAMRPVAHILGDLAVFLGRPPTEPARPPASRRGPPRGRRLADALAPVPDRLTAVEAAALPLAGLTALRLLRTAGNVTGLRILLTGASGGVGHYVTELAAGAGAEVTAVTASAERGQRLTELGAAAVIHDIADAAGPYDLILESTGGKNLPLALDRLRNRGTLIWFGQASREPATLSFFDILSGAASVTIRSFAYFDFDAPYGEDLAVLVRLAAAGRLHPEIGRVGSWADTAATITDLYERRVRGKAILTIP